MNAIEKPMNIEMCMSMTRDPQLIPLLYRTKCPVAIYRGPLTKRTLFSLESGAYIASNIMFSNGLPVIRSRIAGKHNRDHLWKRISKEKLGGRIFSVFNNEAALTAHIRSLHSDS